MEKKVTYSDALQRFNVSAESAADDIKSAGITPASIVGGTRFQTYVVVGITPEQFLTKYAAVEFNYDELRTKFAMYCKDYRTPIEPLVCSKALDFSSKMLFKIGSNLRNEKKSQKVKMVRFHFCYEKTVEHTKSFDIKTVIVSNFKEHNYIKKIGDGKLILTFEQAGMLAIDILIDVIRYDVGTKNQQYLMTPLCGAIFSRDSIIPMSEQLKLSETEVTIIINASTCSGGQYLEESDMACAIVATICVTKRMSNQGARRQIITKIVKQYAARKKQYLPERFIVFSEYALGGVPPGMDANRVIENYNNNEAIAVNRRVAILASNETMLASKSVDAGLSARGASGSRCQW